RLGRMPRRETKNQVRPSRNRRNLMPTIQADDCPIHVEVEGPEGAPVLMLSNSLGTDLTMWDDQVGAFTKHFRLVRYDRRGHGKSGVPEGPYTMDRLREGRPGADGRALST